MVLSHRRRSILLKPEATYGTDSVPVAADALLTSNLRIRPLDGQYVNRELVDGQLGIKPEALSNVGAGVEFGIEAGGGGAAGTAPTWGKVLLACGYAETVNAGTSVEYNLVSSAYGSATIKAHVGGDEGHIQTMTGVRGSAGFTADANALPLFNVNMQGLFTAPAKVAPQATDYSAHQLPPRVEPPNVTVFTLGGETLCFAQFSIEDSRSLQLNRYANCPEVSVGDRAITGRAVVSMPALDAKDLIAEARAETLQALAMTIGTEAGNILSLAAPAVQIKLEGYQDNQGDLDVTLGLNFTPDQGDDEISWTVT
ncbi:MAG: phage tail tube protein [Pseudomonadota bacterium]